jgi:hypothetical protein
MKLEVRNKRHQRCCRHLLTHSFLFPELEKSTDMFRRLADPNGANNALSQVLYGLALRYVLHYSFTLGPPL